VGATVGAIDGGSVGANVGGAVGRGVLSSGRIVELGARGVGVAVGACVAAAGARDGSRGAALGFVGVTGAAVAVAGATGNPGKSPVRGSVMSRLRLNAANATATAIDGPSNTYSANDVRAAGAPTRSPISGAPFPPMSYVFTEICLLISRGSDAIGLVRTSPPTNVGFRYVSSGEEKRAIPEANSNARFWYATPRDSIA